MKYKSRRTRISTDDKMPSTLTNFITIILFLLFASAFYLVLSFTPMTKEEQMEKYKKITDDVEPFRRNLTECARQVKATMVEVESFLKRVPQSSMPGKCFVACMLKRNLIIHENKISTDYLLELHRNVYGEDSEVMSRLKVAIKECSKAVKDIFEICEYASVFNDCMHIKMEHILDQMTMERRMDAISKMTADPEQWTSEEDEIMQLVKDEL